MEKQVFLIVWLKESTGAVCYLHSDKKFYRDFISCRGCNLVTYKTRPSAEKKARTYAHNTDGVIIALESSAVEQLESDWREDRRAVLARYTDGEKLPAFEDAQPDAAGVVTCAVQSAHNVFAGGRRFDALLSKRADVYGWETAVLLIVRTEDYRPGVFSGRPVFVIRPDDLPNVTPHNLAGMIDGNSTFAAILSGTENWEMREKWLLYFTDEEKRAAVAIEKHLQTLAPAV